MRTNSLRPDPSGDPGPGRGPGRRMSRRGFLMLGGTAGLVLAGAGVGAYAADRRLAPLPAVTVGRRSYRSTALTAPRFGVTKTGPTADGLLFLEPQSQPFSGLGGVIVDDTGEPVWIAPLAGGTSMTDLKVQRFEGEPVITYWSGTVADVGYGLGVGNILDASYRPIAQVHAGPGLQADLHEFRLTPAGTALMTSFPTIRADLTSVGGPSNGYLLDCHVQEVDIRTGEVVLSWSALQHIPLTDSYLTAKAGSGGAGTSAATAFDAYHLNAIDFDDSTLYISSRHTHTVYSVDRSSGAVNWRMGGKQSDFAIASDAAFAWQHHVRKRTDGIFTMFNNNTNTQHTLDRSSGLFLNVDETARTVTLARRYGPSNMLTDAEGSVQPLAGGNVLIGWGTDPYVMEFAEDGTTVLTIDGLGVASYRAFRIPWSATPAAPPEIAVSSSAAGSAEVYASWNGATEVGSWRALSGASADALVAGAPVPRSGFETRIPAPRANYYAAEALAADGSVLAVSATVRGR